MEYRDFSSMPPEQERQFVAFERRTVISGKAAWTVAYIAAAAFGVLTLLIVFSFDPPKNQHAEDLETSLSAEEALDDEPDNEPDKPAPKAPEPAPEPAPTEGGATGTEGGATGTEGGAAAPAPTGTESGAAAAPATGAAAAEAPAPPKGATKAPPTALVGDKK